MGRALRHYLRDKEDRIQDGKQVSKHISEITSLATKCFDQSCLVTGAGCGSGV